VTAMTDAAVAELAPRTGMRAACAAVGCAQASWYRRHRASPLPPRPGPIAHRERRQPRALATAERQQILEVLHSERFTDATPAEVWATLLDEGAYLGSVSTFYRVLRAQGEVRERRAQATHPATVKPELMAAAPNQVWSWDITKLHGPAKWTYYYLYVILDIFSRYVTGWMVATRESAALAETLIGQTCAKQQITAGQLAIHADRGSSMTSKPVAFLLADLGVTQSHWCTILMSVAVRLLMHPRCRQVTAFLVSDADDVLNEFCGAWRCPGARRPSTGLYAQLSADQ
jgi:putative transposase